MQESMQVSASASLFAEVTHEAREIVPIITQEFTARIKSNDEAFNALVVCGVRPAQAALLLGKEFTFKVDWGACGGIEHQSCFWLQAMHCSQSFWWLCVPTNQVSKLFTQKGMLPKMYDVWKDISAASKS